MNASRERLPKEHHGLIHRFAFEEPGNARRTILCPHCHQKIEREAKRVRLYLHAGMYTDGRLGEIFLTADKEGSLLSGMFDALAVMISIALQYGVPLEAITEKLRNTRFEPSIEIEGTKEIPHALSILDYLGRYLDLRFPRGHAAADVAELAAGERYDDAPEVTGPLPLENE